MDWFQVSLLLIFASTGSLGTPPDQGCTSDQMCYQTPNWRCLSSPGTGLPCTLDQGYNLTGTCSCATESCANTTQPTTQKKQYLMIGDSISMGYQPYVESILSGEYEIVHPPGNCGNTNWGRRCRAGWLGDLSRWDVISFNFGLHDLADPDNEHIDLDTYGQLLDNVVAQLLQTRANLIWVTTTPVPTNPPENCVLIPHRNESSVLQYNAVAAQVMANLPALYNVSQCDLHKVIVDYCGVGYSTCSIAQCPGPHFTEAGFAMLGKAIAGCVQAAAA
eukprot:TRINITY_DN31057_c0_g1_i1.p1 TRINITY_DN31057_c0_g1~~TRINITY_DN31057_c0_g1_i1.p1  ORF type:complete len:276 (+),score=59.19 TRINITY_DN31057_c0_g1_i1:163-990(+)